MVTIHWGQERQFRWGFFVLLGPLLTALPFYQTLMSSFKVDAHGRSVRTASHSLRRITLNILCHRLVSGSFVTFPVVPKELCFLFSKHSEMISHRAEMHQTVRITQYGFCCERNISS